MTTFQKVIQYVAMAFALFLSISIIGGLLGALGLVGEFFEDDAAVGDIRTYAVSSDISRIEVDMNAADFTIKQGEKFLVESNLSHLAVEDKNGALYIKETKKSVISYTGAALTLYIPADEELEKVSIEAGVGRVTIAVGELHNLDLDMGVGQLNVTSALTGECSFDLGMGESNITVIGDREDYKLDVEKGIGRITVDGVGVSDLKEQGSGDHIAIRGGIGAINLEFKDPDTN